jgi:hypothetical protein
MRLPYRPLLRIALLTAGIVAGICAQAAAREDDASVDAIWVTQAVVFDYRSMGRTYPCEVLAYKIKMILERVGATESLELRRFVCHDLSPYARFEIVMTSPAEATDANIAAVTRYDARDELISRLYGIELPSAADVARFPAVWAPVSFRKMHLDAGDCALLQQIRRQVLPKMSVAVTKDIRRGECDQPSGFGPPSLEVIALLPANADVRRR